MNIKQFLSWFYCAAFMAVLLCAYAIVGAIEARAAYELKDANISRLETALVTCMQGGNLMADDGSFVLCKEAETFPPAKLIGGGNNPEERANN